VESEPLSGAPRSRRSPPPACAFAPCSPRMSARSPVCTHPSPCRPSCLSSSSSRWISWPLVSPPSSAPSCSHRIRLGAASRFIVNSSRRHPSRHVHAGRSAITAVVPSKGRADGSPSAQIRAAPGPAPDPTASSQRSRRVNSLRLCYAHGVLSDGMPLDARPGLPLPPSARGRRREELSDQGILEKWHCLCREKVSAPPASVTSRPRRA
jgi:hypothetical protein